MHLLFLTGVAASVILGLSCALTIFLSKRFGAASWILGLFLGLYTLTAGFCIPTNFISVDFGLRAAVTLMILASPLGLLFSWSINCPNYSKALADKKKFIYSVLLPLPLLLTAFWYWQYEAKNDFISKDFLVLGPSGYPVALYLLIVSIMTLSALEQTIRGAEERVKWEIKFLILGLASNYAAIIYVASKAMLYSPFIPRGALYIHLFILPISCCLIFASWKRSTGYTQMPVSQTVVYGFITLASVGIYLIVSGILTSWLGSWAGLGLQTQAPVFLLFLILLIALLMWTSFRHRARNWIRRNFFAGKYDYRMFWMEATEKVRSVDGPENAALALAHVIQNALGAIDVSIWLRRGDSDALQVAGALGCVAESGESEMKGILEIFNQIVDPITVDDARKISNKAEMTRFLGRTHSSLLVPLHSSGRLVGVLAVGSDRSGRSYNWDSREFLRVLANHAASEFHKHELLGNLVAAKEAEAFASFSTFLLHDLKNFASTLSLIAKNAGRHQTNPDFQRDAFQSIFETSEKMKRLCNNLRLFSSKPAADKKPEDLNQIVKAATGALHGSLNGRLHLELADLPPIYVNSGEIASVLQNLLMNAQQAISPTGSINIKTAHAEDAAELIVADDGMGMAKEFLEKELFLPFRTTKSDGLGVGLFQCKKIVEAHGGAIAVKSEKGSGTEVRIRFPFSIAERISFAGADLGTGK
jgi:putative PEP-CTERM system histidine kinase